jgi:carbamoyl-phosphate synthase large subunit
MRSVGEVMAIGRTFKESLPEGAALARARRAPRLRRRDDDALEAALYANPKRLAAVIELLRRGRSWRSSTSGPRSTRGS